MPKTADRTQTPQTVRLDFDLLSLPTAQHKAGLAGLLLEIRSLEARRREFRDRPLPRVVQLTPTTAALQFTEASLQTLFDDLYAARVVEVRSPSKWAGTAKLKRVDEEIISDQKPGKQTKQKRYIYDVVQPHSPAMRQLLRDEHGDGPWMKLWRDMLWAIPRAQPKARIPYDERARGEPSSEGSRTWQELTRFQQDLRKNRIRTCKLSGALLLGSQATNAENVPFQERSDFALLLHFWPLSVQVFVPQQIDTDGQSDFVGYSIAIPDIADLEYFLDACPAMLRDRKDDVRGYRPAEAIVDIPAQGALEFMRHMAEAVKDRAESHRNRVAAAVNTYEYLHLYKTGNNVKCLAAGRIAPREDLLRQYMAIIDARPQPYRTLLFRSGLLSALLNNQPWYEAFAATLVERPWPFFVRCADTPKAMLSFGQDAAIKFRQVQNEYLQRTEDPGMVESAPAAPPLEMLVHRLVGNYILRKTEDKSGLKWADIKQRRVKDEETGRERVDIPKDFREAREKVAQDLFLAMRSRRDRDFTDYFAASVCSVGQFLTPDEFAQVARELRTNPTDIKTIALLAVSANTY